jgi:thiol-disulfide isomerase/thioredoxin
MRLKNMDDEFIDIKDLKGNVLVINFWATWCPPCRREMGSLEKLHLATRDKNIKVITVNVGEDQDTVFSFIGTVEPAPSFAMLFDTEAATLSDWKVQGLPTTYVVDPEANIVYKAIGGREFNHPEIQNTLIKLAR